MELYDFFGDMYAFVVFAGVMAYTFVDFRGLFNINHYRTGLGVVTAILTNAWTYIVSNWTGTTPRDCRLLPDSPTQPNTLLYLPARTSPTPTLIARLTVLPTNLRIIAHACHHASLAHAHPRLHVYPDTFTAPGAARLLRDWADLLIVHGADAGTLAALAAGLADTLGRAVLRGWYFGSERLAGGGMRRKLLVVVPMLEAGEWRHPVTRETVDKIRGWAGGVVMGNEVCEEMAVKCAVVAVESFVERDY